MLKLDWDRPTLCPLPSPLSDPDPDSEAHAHQINNLAAKHKSTPSLSLQTSTQGKKLKNWHIQEYTTETTFEPKKYVARVIPTMVELEIINKQAVMNKCKHMNRRCIAMILRLNDMPFKYCLIR